MQTILNSNITTKESEIIMNQIVFSAGFVQANIFCSLLCILLPILFVWYQKRKNGVKPGAFFIGAAFCLLFCIFPLFFPLFITIPYFSLQILYIYYTKYFTKLLLFFHAFFRACFRHALVTFSCFPKPAFFLPLSGNPI